MKYIVFALIVTGGIITAFTAKKYNQLLKSAEINTTVPKYAKVLAAVSRWMMAFFIVGYIVGAIDVLLREVEPIYYFVGIVFFLAALFVTLVVKNLEIKTQSLAEQNIALEAAMQQIALNNEELQSQVDSRVQEIVRQDQLLHTANDIAAILLGSELEEFDSKLWSCMGMLAGRVKVDRMYIWKNHVRDGLLRCTQLYEWSEGAAPQQDNELTVDISYDESIPGWEQTLSGGGCVRGLVRELSPEEQAQLTPQGIISILVVPVFLQDRFWGFVGFDDCHRERNFADVEEGILRSVSLLFATALQRNEMTQSLVQAREEALSSTRAKSDFLSNMSHEIRTPINAITGMAGIARKSGDPARINDCLNKIDAASRQLLGLINDILDMSKIEAGKMELGAEPFHLCTTLQNVKSIIGVRAAEKEQTITLEIAPDVPQVVIGDDMRLSQILINLLSNAVKFTPEEGSIQLLVQSLAQDAQTCTLEARVVDTGIGMDEAQIGRLFQAFEQTDRNIARSYGGTGLGLVISRRIAELMQGTITVESALGQGSCFTVTVQLRLGTQDMLRGMESLEQAAQEDFSGLYALLVEDIAINREIVLELLTERGMLVDCAEDGEVAVSLFQEAPEKYDIIFMDVYMPVMDGYGATRAIRAADTARSKQIPIVAMTANAFAEDVQNCLEAGMNDHIAKPIDEKRLFRLIRKYCGGAEARQNNAENK